MPYVATYRRRRAAGRELPVPTVQHGPDDFSRRLDAERWLRREMKNDPRAELGAIRRGDEVVAILFAE
jgi:hypothetical protein